MDNTTLVKQAQDILDDIHREYPVRSFYSWPNKWARLMETVIQNNGNVSELLLWPISAECLHSGYVPLSRMERDLIDPLYRHLAKDPQEFRQPPGTSLSPEGSSGTYTKNLFVIDRIRIHASMLWGSDPNMLSRLFRVVEIGGGYGSLAVILSRYGFTGRHYVIDHPAMHLIRESYLASLGIGGRTIPILPNARMFDRLPSKNVVLIAVHSLDEMGTGERIEYLDSIKPDTYAIYFTQYWDGVDNNVFFDSYILENGLRVLYDYRGYKGIQRFLIFDRPVP